ncbi:methylated-DNA--[protein]-cysteine S-methyltransferase [Acidobacteriota bacterium]
MISTILSFPLGHILLAKTEQGLCLAHYSKTQQNIRHTEKMISEQGLTLTTDNPAFKIESKLFNQYFKGQRVDFNKIPVHFIFGTLYQQNIWKEAAKIPYGKTETYKSLSLKMNHNGFRSAGQALSKNPLIIVVPCHRVLAEGGLGGFSAGLPLKKYLLELEGISYPS